MSLGGNKFHPDSELLFLRTEKARGDVQVRDGVKLLVTSRLGLHSCLQ